MSLTFADLPIRKETIAALNEHGYMASFPIQEQAISIALADGDVIGQAKVIREGTAGESAKDEMVRKYYLGDNFRLAI